MKPIHGVCFDATGTLFTLREAVGETYARAAASVGVRLPAWRVDDAFARVLRLSPPLERAGAGRSTRAGRVAAERDWWRERVRQTFQATDSTVRFPDPTAFADGLFERYRGREAWQARPGIDALLARLAGAGLALGVASNFDHRLPDLLEALGLARFFGAVAIPCEHGFAKPDAALFDRLAEALGTERSALAYVGDDAPAILEAIAALEIRVFDIRAFSALEALGDALLAGAVRAGQDR